MHDNKKWGTRFSTIFWWALSILPFIYIMVVLIGCIANFNTLGGTPVTSDTLTSCFNYSIQNAMQQCINTFSIYCITDVVNALRSCFTHIGVSAPSFWGVTIGYMVTVACVHLVFDILVWLPNLAHYVLDRWC